MVDIIRRDEKAGLRRNAIRSQVIDALKAQEIEDLFSKNVVTTADLRNTTSPSEPAARNR
jgi:hypothetical protein